MDVSLSGCNIGVMGEPGVQGLAPPLHVSLLIPQNRHEDYRTRLIHLRHHRQRQRFGLWRSQMVTAHSSQCHQDPPLGAIGGGLRTLACLEPPRPLGQ
jgi:hypothetical protein